MNYGVTKRGQVRELKGDKMVVDEYKVLFVKEYRNGYFPNQLNAWKTLQKG